MPSPRKIRTIVEQQKLEKDLLRCGVSPKKLDRVTQGLGDTICTRPEVLQRDEETGWSCIMVKHYPGIPSLRIWYTYSDDEIFIEAVDLLSEFL